MSSISSLVNSDHGLHKHPGPYTGAIAVLHVIHLTDHGTRGTARKRRSDTVTHFIFAVTCRADYGLARARLDQFFAFLNAADWHIGDEARPAVAENFGPLRVHGNFDDALAERFPVVAVEGEEHPSHNSRFGHGRCFDDLEIRRPRH